MDKKMVYEYSCGGCRYYGGLGDCTRPMENCIKDEPLEKPYQDEPTWEERKEEEFRANWGDGR